MTCKHMDLTELPTGAPAAEARTHASLQRGTGAGSRRLSSPTLPLSASLGTSLTLAPDEDEGSLPPCITDATQTPAPILQLLYLCSLASITNTFDIHCLLIFLPWSLAAVLTAHHAAR